MKREMEKLVHSRLAEQYDRYYRLAFGIVKNEQDAMDVVQEAAYKAILNCGSLRKREYVDTWLYRIVVNEAMNLFRKRKQEILSAEETELSHNDHYRDFDLELAIENLDEKERVLITLRFFEDMQLDQIAEVLEENLSTVKSRLYRTLKKLRIMLE